MAPFLQVIDADFRAGVVGVGKTTFTPKPCLGINVIGALISSGTLMLVAKNVEEQVDSP